VAGTPDDVRELAVSLPRSYEAFVRGRVKFRVGQIVCLALSSDGSRMGCGFPTEFRDAAVDSEPGKFSLPSESDMRFSWIHVNLGAIDHEEMRDLVEGAWSRAVPQYVAQDSPRHRVTSERAGWTYLRSTVPTSGRSCRPDAG